MEIQIGDIILYNVYLLPEVTNWAWHLEADPCMALAYADGLRILIMGDLNSRLIPIHCIQHHTGAETGRDARTKL